MGLAHRDLPIFGVQFHPESILTGDGKAMLASFLDVIDAKGRGTNSATAAATAGAMGIG
jgi:carbamoylphosphate synthase small subunit